LVSAVREDSLKSGEALPFAFGLVAGILVLPILSIGPFTKGDRGTGWILLGGGVVLGAGSFLGLSAVSRAKFKKSKLPQEMRKMFRTIQAIERADVETVKACKAVIGQTFPSQEEVTAAQSACTAALPIVSEGDAALSEQSHAEMRVAYSWRTPEHGPAIRVELERLADFAGVDSLYFSCMEASKGTAPSISSQSSDWMEQRKKDCVLVQEFLKKYPTQSVAFGLLTDRPLTKTIKRIDKVYPSVKAKEAAREARERKEDNAREDLERMLEKEERRQERENARLVEQRRKERGNARSVEHTKYVNFKIGYDLQNLTDYCPQYTCTHSIGSSAFLDARGAGVQQGGTNMYIECFYIHDHY
jgi:hypothetical protein